MKVVHLLFQILNLFPAGLIVSLAPLKFSLKSFALRPFRLIKSDQLLNICLNTFKHIIKA